MSLGSFTVMSIGLLVASNVAWFIAYASRAAAQSAPAAPVETIPVRVLTDRVTTLEQQVRTLQSELAQVRQSVRSPRVSTPTASAATPAPNSATEPRPSGRDSNAGTAQPAAQPMRPAAIATEWEREVCEPKEPARRDAALASVRQALLGKNPENSWAALLAVAQIGSVDYDKAEMRRFVEPYLSSEDDRIRVSALYAAFNTERKPSDREIALRLADAATLAGTASAGHLINLFSDGNLSGASSDAVLKLLRSENLQVVNETLRGISRAQLSPELIARVIELSRQPDTRQNAIYFGLSQSANHGRALVDELVRVASDRSADTAARAAWGLAQLEDAELAATATDGLMKVFATRPPSRVAEEILRTVAAIGDPRAIPALEAAAADTALDEGLRNSATQALERVRRRGGR